MREINAKLKKNARTEGPTTRPSQPEGSRKRQQKRLGLLVIALCLVPVSILYGQEKGANGAALANANGGTNSTTPPPVLNGRAKLASHYNPHQMLRLAFVLKPPYLDEERDLVRQLHDKKSPQFHKFLTAAEWNARFAPSVQDEQAVVGWAQSHGLSITHRYPNRLLVDVEAPAGTIEKALNVTLNNYQLGSTSFFSNDREPSLPANLTEAVWSVLGLNSLEHDRPVSKRSKAPSRPDYMAGPVEAAGASFHADADPSKMPASLAKALKRKDSEHAVDIPETTNGAYDPTDIFSSEAYDFNALYAQGHCCNPLDNLGQSPPETSIAIATFDYVDPADIAGFQAQYPYLAYNVEPIAVDGTGIWAYGQGPTDVEWALATANSFGSSATTSKVYAYQGANLANNTVTDVYNAILNDGHARVFATAWGCAEGVFDATWQWGYTYDDGGDCYNSTMSARDAIFLSMVGQGWTLVAESGDEGAAGQWCNPVDAVMFPGSDPNVISVGGTTLILSPGPIFSSEVGWSGGYWGCGAADGGSTGGFSTYWSAPDFQQQMGYTSRSVPDIALNADWYNTPQNIYFGGALAPLGTTGMAAAEMAGFFAQENAYLLVLGNVCGDGYRPCAPMGNADWYIYESSLGAYSHPAHYPFYDTTSGCNNNDVTAAYGLNYYCAQPGYDQVTGWGSANMLQLAWAINWFSTNYSGAPGITFSGPPVNQWYSSDQTVSWIVADNSHTAIAGFTAEWDSLPDDPVGEATPGSGNSFYSGPVYTNATTGSLSFVNSGVGQGCHTAYVEAWDNMGEPTTLTYGPLCYDTIMAVTSVAFSGTSNVNGYYTSPVTATLTATDSGSGVRAPSTRLTVERG